MAKFQRHIFVCTNKRPAESLRGCCSLKDGEAVAAAFKARLHARGFKRIVRSNASGCLDQCERGVTVVVYPEAVWYGGVRVEDVDEIIESHVVGGCPVERLRIPDRELTGLEPQTPGAGSDSSA